jgi:uncharacterized protein YfiM (DUF2279 family)
MPVEMIFLFFLHGYEPTLNVPINITAFSKQYMYHYNTVLEQLDDFDANPEKPEDKWFGMDKFWHWAMAFTLTGSSYHLVHNRINVSDPGAMAISLSGTLFFSILKEFYDLFSYNLFSFKDLCYDVLGMATGYMVFIWDWE